VIVCKLQQVLLNLVMNGMDAMNTIEESQRGLIIAGRRETRDGSYEAVLSVQDAGIGSSLRSGTGSSRRSIRLSRTGMGMGLAISRSIIEAHAGRLWAEANPGSGATFFINLPAAPEALAKAGLPPPSPNHDRFPVPKGVKWLPRTWFARTITRSLAAFGVIAMFASYASLDLAGRVTAARGWIRAIGC